MNRQASHHSHHSGTAFNYPLPNYALPNRFPTPVLSDVPHSANSAGSSVAAAASQSGNTEELFDVDQDDEGVDILIGGRETDTLH